MNNEEEYLQIENDIEELNASNINMESQMVTLRLDISTLENNVQTQQRENLLLEENTNKLNEYENSLKNQLISCLKLVKVPQLDEFVTDDDLDIFMTKIQNQCLNRNGENNQLFNAIKNAVSEINIA